MKYCESRVFGNGVRSTFISFGDSDLEINESYNQPDFLLWSVHGDFLPEPPLKLRDDEILISSRSCPFVLSKS